MGLKEHQIGKGTLGYKGETAEYYESKRGLWDHFRWVLAAICLLLGAAFLVASASPVVSARVVSVTDNGARALWRIRHPRPQMTTVIVPDDTYALPPH